MTAERESVFSMIQSMTHEHVRTHGRHNVPEFVVAGEAWFEMLKTELIEGAGEELRMHILRNGVKDLRVQTIAGLLKVVRVATNTLELGYSR